MPIQPALLPLTAPAIWTARSRRGSTRCSGGGRGFFVGTGTAANSLALSAVNRPGGVSFCHREAHVIADECGAPEFFSQGARLARRRVEGKMDPFNA
jgi:threonine aldolase